MAKDEALKKKEARETLADKESNKYLPSASLNYHNPSRRANLKTMSRLLFEDLVASAERNFNELRNGKVAEYEATPLIDYSCRPGNMFNSEELRELYDSTTCDDIHKVYDRNCSNELNVYLYRTSDGTCNNLNNPTYGAMATEFKRALPPHYENGVNSPRGRSQTICNSSDNLLVDDLAGHCSDKEECNEEEDYMYEKFLFENPADQDPCKGVHGPFSPPVPSARHVTARVHLDSKLFQHPFTDTLFEWGRFVINDVSNSPEIGVGVSPRCVECQFDEVCDSIRVHSTDPLATAGSSYGSGIRCLKMRRTVSECLYQSGEYPPRQQLNDVTAFLDASTVYGSIFSRSSQLRTFQQGLLKSNPPTSSVAKETLPVDISSCQQSINNKEFLCGDFCCVEDDPLTSFHTLWLRQHNRIATGLSELNPDWSDELLYQEARKIVSALIQKITYKDYLPKIFTGDYFDRLIGQYKGYNGSLDPQVKMAFNDIAYPALVSSNLIIRDEEMGNALSFSLQRGREHGIPTYLEWRNYISEKFPFLPEPSLKNEDQIKEVYGSFRNVDLVIGGIAEDRLTTTLNQSALFSPTFAAILGLAFKNLRNADRFFYERRGIFTSKQYEQIEGMTLSRLMCDNWNNVSSVSEDVFLDNMDIVDCNTLPELNLSHWKELVCYLKVNGPNHIIKRGRVISISTHKNGGSIPRVYSNEQSETCLPVTCPLGSADLAVYAFPDLESFSACSVSSSIPHQSVQDGASLFFTRTLSSTLIQEEVVFKSLKLCEAAKRTVINWECSEQAKLRPIIKSSNVGEVEVSDQSTSPDSLTPFPVRLTEILDYLH